MPENEYENQVPSTEDKMCLNSEDQAKTLLDAYGKIMDVWKVQNDNYFKRVQVAMGVIQVGLFVAILKMFFPLPTTWTQAVLPITIAILGFVSGIMWVKLNGKQIQYIEFCRRSLRNIESKLAMLKVPLEYFTLESIVFGPISECRLPYSASIEKIINASGKERSQITFRWSGEKYPDTDSHKKTLHSITRVSGGMVSFESWLAKGAVALWVLIAITLSIAFFKPCNDESFVTIKQNEVKALPNKANAADAKNRAADLRRSMQPK
jgi:hypothetical protein